MYSEIILSVRNAIIRDLKRQKYPSSLFVKSRMNNSLKICKCYTRNAWPAALLPQCSEWGYLQKDGPATWPQKYPEAGGSSQSPIDINSSVTELSPELQKVPLHYIYRPKTAKVLVNAGSGWRVDLVTNDEKEDSEEGLLIGGPLDNSYKLSQFHCHWGPDKEVGSEHTVEGKHYAAELHFVNWNSELHATVSDALKCNKGFAVIAVFLEIGEPNPEVEKLCEAVSQASYREQTCALPSDFNVHDLYPADRSYWTYSGSLTTPPCNENVKWIIFKNPIMVSDEQLNVFRTMKCFRVDEEPPKGHPHDGEVRCNYRPVQEINDRGVQFCLCSP